MNKNPKEPKIVKTVNDIGKDSSFDESHKALESEIAPVLLGSTVIDEALTKKEGELGNIFLETCSLRILMALRRIMHFVDMYSRKLANEHNITGPQLICLYAVVKEGPLTLSELGKRVSLSMSTVNGIVDRLEYKGFVMRERKDRDRRKVLVTATDTGKDVSSQAPLPLQDRLAQTVSQLPELEQVSIALSLERIVEMMEEKQGFIASDSENLKTNDKSGD